MNPTDFAKALRCTQDEREASWNGSRYTKDFHEAAKSYFEPVWIPIVNVILSTGYADIWDWCDQVDPL